MDFADYENLLDRRQKAKSDALDGLAEISRRLAWLEDEAAIDNQHYEGKARPVELNPDLADQHVHADYPNLPRDRVHEVAEGRRAKRAADEKVLVTTHQLDEAVAEFERFKDQLLVDEAAEQRAGAVHWDRRFHTSLAIGHGAAFAAIINHVFDKDTSRAAIQAASPAIVIFALGLLTSGAIPWVRAFQTSYSYSATLSGARRSRETANAMALAAALLFIQIGRAHV